MNKLYLSGKITLDVELRKASINYARLGLAVNNYKGEAEFFNITAFGKLAERCAEYLIKGQSVIIEAHVKPSVLEDEEGNKIYNVDLIADNVEFGAKPKATSKEDKAVLKVYKRS